MHQIWVAAVLFETKDLTDHQFPHFCYAAVELYNEIDWETDQAEKNNQEKKKKKNFMFLHFKNTAVSTQQVLRIAQESITKRCSLKIQ